MRSRFGCLTCKQRKLKCDEKKPLCGPCSRTSRNCTYAAGAEFRHFGGSRASPPDDEETGPSFLEDQVWLDIPQQLTYVHVEDPYEDEDMAVSPPPANAAEDDFPISPAIDKSSNSNMVYDETIPCDPGAFRAYLLWHFKQGPSQWMDLFDTNGYFSGQIPLLAATSPMLLSAACALSAKRISRELESLREHEPEKLQSHQAIVSCNGVNWHYQTIQFYDEAIQQLKEELTPEALHLRRTNGDEFPEDIFGVVAIMSMFELMDAPGVEWRAHLRALPLLNEASQTTANVQSPLDHSRRAIFWSFARQDVISAFVHETQTFLNLDDVTLWNQFGLNTSDFGISMSVQELSHFSPPEQWAGGSQPEESISNAMTWILGRIINFITAGDSLDPFDFSSPTGRQSMFSVPQESLLQRWSLLEHDLTRWYQSRPSTLDPCARTSLHTRDPHPADDDETPFERIWYTIPMCAAAMQSYHMARILLLMNRPQESTAIRSTVTARLTSYRDTERQVLQHGREICGISLSMPPEPVQVHSLQPLFVAGQCFSSVYARRIVLELLVGVEKDLGWASTYYVDKLREEWQQVDLPE